MADSQRTRAELEQLFADNQSGAISAQDARDFLMSVYLKPEIEALIAQAKTEMQAFVTEKVATYIHTQVAHTMVWTINHGLGKYPSVDVLDGNGNELLGTVTWPTDNQVVITFSSPYNGKAYLN